MKCSSNSVVPTLRMEPKENRLNINISVKPTVDCNKEQIQTNAAEKKMQKPYSVMTRSKAQTADKKQKQLLVPSFIAE